MTIPKFQETKPSDVPKVVVLDEELRGKVKLRNKNVGKCTRKVKIVTSLSVGILVIMAIIVVTFMVRGYIHDRDFGKHMGGKEDWSGINWNWCGTDELMHASCEMQWSINTSCVSPMEAIVNYIKAQSSIYNLEQVLEGNVWANHTNHTGSQGNYTLKISLYFEDSVPQTDRQPDRPQHCTITGFSTRDSYISFYDTEKNYCILDKLIYGAQLQKATGLPYKEKFINCEVDKTTRC